jgi:5-methylcytosine-specific restriction endonuclease McrA
VKNYSLTHLADSTLLHDLKAIVARDQVATAEMLAHIAEVDARRLYAPAAYPSMYAYCLGELHLSEDAAAKRIQAARVARRLPVVFEALADGRVHLSAVVMLATYLEDETVDELLAAATHKSKSEIERFLAERFPKQDVPTVVREVRSSSFALSAEAHAPGHVNGEHAPGHVENFGDLPKVKPLSPHRFALQVTIDQSTHDKLRRAQTLLGHRIPLGDVAGVLDRALDALIHQLEKRKFAATAKPRAARSATPGSRRVPAHVKRAVRQRDGGRCTFVSPTGQRCPGRDRLEFDHRNEFARGGESTVANIRLLCRAHNQYEAERTFGAGFMSGKRRAAAEARAAAKAEAEARARAEAERANGQDVIPYLRALEIGAKEARGAAAHCESIPDAPLEQRVRHALSFIHTRIIARTGATAVRGAPA